MFPSNLSFDWDFEFNRYSDQFRPNHNTVDFVLSISSAIDPPITSIGSFDHICFVYLTHMIVRSIGWHSIQSIQNWFKLTHLIGSIRLIRFVQIHQNLIVTNWFRASSDRRFHSTDGSIRSIIPSDRWFHPIGDPFHSVIPCDWFF